ARPAGPAETREPSRLNALSLKKLFKIDPAVAVLHGFTGSARSWGGEQVNSEDGPKCYQALEYVLRHRMKTDRRKVVSGEVSARPRKPSWLSGACSMIGLPAWSAKNEQNSRETHAAGHRVNLFGPPKS